MGGPCTRGECPHRWRVPEGTTPALPVREGCPITAARATRVTEAWTMAAAVEAVAAGDAAGAEMDEAEAGAGGATTTTTTTAITTTNSSSNHRNLRANLRMENEKEGE